MEKFLNDITSFLKLIVDLLKRLLGIDDYETMLQTVEITKAIAVAAGTYEDKFELESGWDFADGVRIQEFGAGYDGGLAYFEVGIQDDKIIYNSITHKDAYVSTTAVPPKDRFLPIYIPVRAGNKIQIKTKLPAAVAGDALFYQIQFKVRRKKQ